MSFLPWFIIILTSFHNLISSTPYIWYKTYQLFKYILVSVLQIKKLSRWEVIDVVRTMSTEQAKQGQDETGNLSVVLYDSYLDRQLISCCTLLMFRQEAFSYNTLPQQNTNAEFFFLQDGGSLLVATGTQQLSTWRGIRKNARGFLICRIGKTKLIDLILCTHSAVVLLFIFSSLIVAN